MTMPSEPPVTAPETITRVGLLRQQAKPYQAMLAIGVLLIFLAWLASVAFQPDQYNETPHSRAITNRFNALAKSCGGDISKLSPDDQEWVQKMTAGHGGWAMRELYKHPH